MKETSCDIIRDLLPLYEDNAVSEKTAQMVREHLKDCPACQEELRKMRVPISLPPDGDEEAVKRFLEHRAEVRKKQNIKIACVVSVLTVMIGFCLCYILIPRNWDGVSHGTEPDRIMGSYTEFVFRNDQPEIDLWQIKQEYGHDTSVIDQVIDALRAGSYRAELRNVLNYTPLGGLLDTSVEGFRTTNRLYLVKDDQITVSIFLYDRYKNDDYIAQITTEGNPNWFFYHVDGQTYDMLAALVKKYGIQE